jgi:hypothetical protein
MSTTLDLLVELHNSGIYLRAVSDEELEYEGPETLLTDEVMAGLKKHKAELLGLLKWDEERAHALIKEALGHLAKRHVQGSDLSVLGPWEDQMNEAYSTKDMAALQVAVRGFVQVGLASLGSEDDA